MKVIPTNTDVLILEPSVFRDPRGFFLESYNRREIQEILGHNMEFVQDNHSHSEKGVLRGLHYQLPHPQGKLVRVVAGEVFDVGVDLRRSSSTFGKWTGVTLSSDNPQLVWIPPGFAHGFLVLSDTAEFLYKTTDYYNTSSEHCLKWDDPDVGIEWPIKTEPKISLKDSQGFSFNSIPLFS